MATTAFQPNPNMVYRNLGPSGLRVPVFSYGGWLTVGYSDYKGPTVTDLMKTAWENGINMFDTAEGYNAGESEIEMGKAFKELKWDRRDFIISTKIFFGTERKEKHNTRGLSRKHVIEGLNKSLQNLQLDYVDVVFAHRPDVTTPMEETVRAFNYLIDHGKAFYWGTSEWTPMQIQQAIEIARRLNMVGPIAEQPQYHMFHRHNFESNYHPLWRYENYGSTIFSALAGGLLTGKYNDGIPDGSRYHLNPTGIATGKEKWLQSEEGKSQIDKVRKLTALAETLGGTVGSLALAWVLKHPNVSTIILGATKPQQLVENIKALDILPKLTDSVMAEIEGIIENKPTPPPAYGRRDDNGKLI